MLTLWSAFAPQDASNTLEPFLELAHEATARERRRSGTAEGARRPWPMNPQWWLCSRHMGRAASARMSARLCLGSYRLVCPLGMGVDVMLPCGGLVHS